MIGGVTIRHTMRNWLKVKNKYKFTLNCGTIVWSNFRETVQCFTKATQLSVGGTFPNNTDIKLYQTIILIR